MAKEEKKSSTKADSKTADKKSSAKDTKSKDTKSAKKSKQLELKACFTSPAEMKQACFYFKFMPVPAQQ